MENRRVGMGLEISQEKNLCRGLFHKRERERERKRGDREDRIEIGLRAVEMWNLFRDRCPRGF